MWNKTKEENKTNYEEIIKNLNNLSNLNLNEAKYLYNNLINDKKDYLKIKEEEYKNSLFYAIFKSFILFLLFIMDLFFLVYGNLFIFCLGILTNIPIIDKLKKLPKKITDIRYQNELKMTMEMIEQRQEEEKEDLNTLEITRVPTITDTPKDSKVLKLERVLERDDYKW